MSVYWMLRQGDTDNYWSKKAGYFQAREVATKWGRRPTDEELEDAQAFVDDACAEYRCRSGPDDVVKRVKVTIKRKKRECPCFRCRCDHGS